MSTTKQKKNVKQAIVAPKPKQAISNKRLMETPFQAAAKRARGRKRKGPLGGAPHGGQNRAIKQSHFTGGPAGTGLSACASWYAKAVSNPFGQFDELPCVPCEPAVPSYRFRNLSRRAFTTGAQGVGFVMIAPQDWANDDPSISITTTLFNGTTYSLPAAGVTRSVRSGLPFQVASADGISGRLVGLGMRCRNITQALNVGGLLIGSTVDTQSDLTNYSQQQVLDSTDSVLAPQALSDQTEWSQIVWRPKQDMDRSFQPSGDNSTINANPSMGFLAIAPGVLVPQTYEVEIQEFWEFIGESPTTSERVPGVENSHADPVGLARVSDGSQTMPDDLTKEAWARETAGGIVEAIAHSDSVAKTVEDLMGLAGMTLPIAGKLAASLLGFLLV